MSMVSSLRGVLAGGREFAGAWGKYVRTKSSDGIFRLYKECDGELVFAGAKKVGRFSLEDGRKAISKETILPDGVQEFVWREYSSTGKKLRTEYELNNFDMRSSLLSGLRDGDISNKACPNRILNPLRSLSVTKESALIPARNSMTRNINGSKMYGYEDVGHLPGRTSFRDLSDDELAKFERFM